MGGGRRQLGAGRRTVRERLRPGDRGGGGPAGRIHVIGPLLLFGYRRGAAMMRTPGADRHRREQLSADERAFWGIVLSAAWSLGLALVLALLHVYTSQRLLAANAALVV